MRSRPASAVETTTTRLAGGLNLSDVGQRQKHAVLHMLNLQPGAENPVCMASIRPAQPAGRVKGAVRPLPVRLNIRDEK